MARIRKIVSPQCWRCSFRGRSSEPVKHLLNVLPGVYFEQLHFRMLLCEYTRDFVSKGVADLLDAVEVEDDRSKSVDPFKHAASLRT
jgi:hypothetical protein